MKQFLLLTLLHTFTASAFEFTGKVVGVADGDTITVLAEGNKQHKVRLQHIDCPESRQPFGSKAKQFLSQKVFGKSVTVKWDEMDRYKRILGNVYLGEEWVNLELGKAKAAKRGIITSARSWIALIRNASSVASASNRPSCTSVILACKDSPAAACASHRASQ
jgi:endonuclease YncB( thermonuclease family)